MLSRVDSVSGTARLQGGGGDRGAERNSSRGTKDDFSRRSGRSGAGHSRGVTAGNGHGESGNGVLRPGQSRHEADAQAERTRRPVDAWPRGLSATTGEGAGGVQAGGDQVSR